MSALASLAESVATSAVMTRGREDGLTPMRRSAPLRTRSSARSPLRQELSE